MTDRMHPADLRAIVAASIAADPLTFHGPGWEAKAAVMADGLLAELERTAKPEPWMLNSTVHGIQSEDGKQNHAVPEWLFLQWNRMAARAEKAEAERDKARAEGAKAERERIARALHSTLDLGGIPFAMVTWDESAGFCGEAGTEVLSESEILAALDPGEEANHD